MHLGSCALTQSNKVLANEEESIHVRGYSTAEFESLFHRHIIPGSSNWQGRGL